MTETAALNTIHGQHSEAWYSLLVLIRQWLTHNDVQATIARWHHGTVQSPDRPREYTPLPKTAHPNRETAPKIKSAAHTKRKLSKTKYIATSRFVD